MLSVCVISCHMRSQVGSLNARATNRFRHGVTAMYFGVPGHFWGAAVGEDNVSQKRSVGGPYHVQ